MKISNIIKQSLVERRLISENEVGQQTRSYDLNNPEDVLNAVKANGCWKKWGLTKLPSDYPIPNDYTITYRGQQKTIPKQTRALYDPTDKDFFLGEKIQGESDKDNTYFYGFNVETKQGFRWKCDALRSVDQAGTRNVTPAQQKLLDDFLSTYGGVYTEIGGKGRVAKDIRGLKYIDGRSIWDENTGIPPEGNYVYIQDTLYNTEPNQLLKIAKDLENAGWTTVTPFENTPEFRKARRLNDLFPGPGRENIMLYPKDASKITSVTTDRRLGGGVKMNKEVCKPAIQFLAKCMEQNGEYAGCDNPNKVNDDKYTAARCYYSTLTNPQFKGILGLGDELKDLNDNTKKTMFGISNEVAQLERNLSNANKNRSIASVNEGSLVYTIKNHLLENIRNKNSQL